MSWLSITFWGRVDALLHALRIPLNWVCDRYDRALFAGTRREDPQ